MPLTAESEPSVVGWARLLDQATDPPLRARPHRVPRPRAGMSYDQGDTFGLCADGLIERRDEDIHTGLAHLTRALAQDTTLAPDQLADTLLVRLGVANGASDDIVLIVIRLRL